MSRETQRRTLLVIASGLVLAVGTVVAVSVIPQVKSVPQGSAETAVPAFWASVIAHAVVGLALFVAGLRNTGRTATLLASSGFAAPWLGLLLLDAAFAYSDPRRGLEDVADTLRFCFGVDLLVGMLAVAATFMRPRSSVGETDASRRQSA
jgi:hypothetical protein